MAIEFNGDLRDDTNGPVPAPYSKSSGNSNSSGGAIQRMTADPRFPGKGYYRVTLDAKDPANASNHRNELHVNSSETFDPIGVDEGERRFYAMSVRFPPAGHLGGPGWKGTTNFGLFWQCKNVICNGGIVNGKDYPNGLSPTFALDHRNGLGVRIAIRGGDGQGGPSSAYTQIQPVCLPDADVPKNSLIWMDWIVEILFHRSTGQVRVYYKEGQEASFSKIFEDLSQPTMHVDSTQPTDLEAPPVFERIGYYRGPQIDAMCVDHSGHIRTTTLAEAQAFFGETAIPPDNPTNPTNPVPTVPTNVPRTDTTNVFGATTTGDTWGDLSGDYWRASSFTAPISGKLAWIEAFIDGKGSGANETNPSAPAVQSYFYTVHGPDNTHIGSTGTGVVTSNDAEAWKRLTFSPGFEPTIVAGQTYRIGILSSGAYAENPQAAPKVGRYAYLANQAGALQHGGDDWPFAAATAPTSTDNKLVAIYAKITPTSTPNPDPPPAGSPGRRVAGTRTARTKVVVGSKPVAGGGGM